MNQGQLTIVEEAESSAAAGRFGDALAMVDRELALTPAEPALLFARASTYLAWGRFHEARKQFLRIELSDLREESLPWQLQLGWTCYQLGDLAEAVQWMQKAVRDRSDSASAHFALGVVLQAQRRTEEAIESYRHALALRRNDVDCLTMLGACMLAQGHASAAEAVFREAIAIDALRSATWTSLGDALRRQERFQDALEADARANQLAIDSGVDEDSFLNLGVDLRDSGHLAEAIEIYEHNLTSRPSCVGHVNYGIALLTAGRLWEGWRHFEFRWMFDPLLSLRPKFRHPAWNGQALRGKTILLRIEQGIGDTIQCLRYAPALKAMGATVLLQTPENFGLLRCDGIDRIIHDSVGEQFDYYLHLLSLPQVFGTDLSTIPTEIPYVHAEESHLAYWKERIGKGTQLNVGLVWAGSPTHLLDEYRSFALHTLAPIIGLKSVQFYSLQKGTAEIEARNAEFGSNFKHLGDELRDLSDTAAVVSLLDLVLCVDTSIAHLAGALGKRVWVMLPTPADWRWMERRDDSPWYPTLRLFRQKRRGDWDEVIERVKAALEERVQQGTDIEANVKMGPQAAPTMRPAFTPAERLAGHRPGLSAVAEAKAGIVQYLPDEAIVGESIAWYGEYLQAQLDLMLRIMRPGAATLEVGAGVGIHAIPLSAALGEAGHLFLYESRSVLQRILRHNLAANRVTNVTVMQRDLGRVSGTADADGRPVGETLDELKLDRLDWLKVNASASPLAVLNGAADSLWRLRPLMLLAVADEVKLGELADHAGEFSYRCWRMETALFNPQNFNRRETDIFGGRTALALLAIPEEFEVDVVLDHCIEIS